jgi:DNA-directed RNA polymerase specialized sigma24 family protein
VAKIVRAPAASTVRSRLARARRDLAEELTEAPRETLDRILASGVHGLWL